MGHGSTQTTHAAAGTVTSVVLSQVVHFLTFGGIALLLPLIQKDFDITFSQAGMLSAAATLSYAMGQIPAGYLSDRFGPRRLFFAGLLGWSVLSLALAILHAYWAALLVLFLAGAFRAMIFAPGLALLASWFPRERRATAMSLFLVGSYSGTIVLALTGPALAQHVGWRWAFGLFSALGIAAAFGFWKCAREKSEPPSAGRFRALSARVVFRQKIVWVCNALQFIRFSVVVAFNFWLPSLLLADRGFALPSVGLIVAMSAAFSAPANALGGYVSDRIGNPPLVIGASLAVLACMCVLLVTVQSTAALLIVIAVSSIFLQFYFGPLFLVPVEVLGARTTGTVTGFGNLCANLGGLITAYVLGVVKDTAGSFTWGFFGMAGLCITGVILSALLARMRTRALAARQRERSVAYRLQEA